MNERSTILVKLILTHLLLPVTLLALSLFIRYDALLSLLLCQLVLLILYFSGYWEFFGIRFRGIFLASLEVLLLGIVVIKVSRGDLTEIHPWISMLFALLSLFLLFHLAKILQVIGGRDPDRVDIGFPFGEGRYLVTDGGNSRTSRLMNYHFHSRVHKKKGTNLSMLYATDIVRLVGNRFLALPKTNTGYALFGAKLYSPVEGTVVRVVNDIPDNTPFSGNYPYNTGNTVVIRNGDLYLLLGHLKQGSIRVGEGDRVQAGEEIAAAGNSGFSERPHLHMQMSRSASGDFWFGKGVCIIFRNRNLYKNRLIRIP